MTSDPGSYGKTSPTWIVSSAAPRHATGNRALLSDLVTKHGDMFVHAVDEMPMPVVAHGTAITDEINLPNVWLVPGLTANLVSICQLVEMDYSVEFGSGMCYIRNSSDGTIVGKAHLRKGGLSLSQLIKKRTVPVTCTEVYVCSSSPGVCTIA